jgi:hypothetical protein
VVEESGGEGGVHRRTEGGSSIKVPEFVCEDCDGKSAHQGKKKGRLRRRTATGLEEKAAGCLSANPLPCASASFVTCDSLNHASTTQRPPDDGGWQAREEKRGNDGGQTP